MSLSQALCIRRLEKIDSIAAYSITFNMVRGVFFGFRPMSEYALIKGLISISSTIWSKSRTLSSAVITCSANISSIFLAHSTYMCHNLFAVIFFSQTNFTTKTTLGVLLLQPSVLFFSRLFCYSPLEIFRVCLIETVLSRVMRKFVCRLREKAP